MFLLLGIELLLACLFRGLFLECTTSFRQCLDCEISSLSLSLSLCAVDLLVCCGKFPIYNTMPGLRNLLSKRMILVGCCWSAQKSPLLLVGCCCWAHSSHRDRAITLYFFVCVAVVSWSWTVAIRNKSLWPNALPAGPADVCRSSVLRPCHSHESRFGTGSTAHSTRATELNWPPRSVEAPGNHGPTSRCSMSFIFWSLQRRATCNKHKVAFSDTAFSLLLAITFSALSLRLVGSSGFYNNNKPYSKKQSFSSFR